MGARAGGRLIASLKWHLDNSEHLEFIAEREATKAKPNPDMPEIGPNAEPYRAAFWHLHGMRQMGLGSIGAIPETEIAAWLDNSEVDDPDERSLLHRLIVLMDSVFRAWWRENQGKK